MGYVVHAELRARLYSRFFSCFFTCPQRRLIALLLAAFVSTSLPVSLASPPAHPHACANNAHGTRPMTLCNALQANDRQALRGVVDEFLGSQNPNVPAKSRMEALRQWIAGQEGVASAELNPDLVDTDPPIGEIWVTLDGDPAIIRTLGISLDPRGLRFNIR